MNFCLIDLLQQSWKRCAKEQEKLLCKGVYFYLVSTQLASVKGDYLCSGWSSASKQKMLLSCARSPLPLGIQNDKSQNNFLMFRKDLTSKLIMLEMVCLVINQGLYGIIVVNTRRKWVKMYTRICNWQNHKQRMTGGRYIPLSNNLYFYILKVRTETETSAI